MQTAIRAEGLGKRYRIGSGAPAYATLRESLARAAAAPLRALRRGAPRAGEGDGHRDFWALRDVSFEVAQGEAVGIIGRNGAGKSTLLRILSRITHPTDGRAEVRGRVGSLLEVGTGFHPELTGRENVYLNGSILGMGRRYIDRRFDEIVDFSGVERFIDTPVKRYSSGMYLRLAFAVAAHLEPEILIVDEVLAVGDASFQKKCLGKMEDVTNAGRTVLFVSHDMAAVARLCSRTLLLDGGRVVTHGPTHAVVQEYLQSGLGTSAERRWTDPLRAPGNEVARLWRVRVRGQDGATLGAADLRRPVGLEMEWEALQPGHVLVPNFHLFNEQGVCVFVAHDTDPAWRAAPRPAGRYLSTAWIPGDLLSEGMFLAGAAVSTHDPLAVHFYERDAVAFHGVDTLDPEGPRGQYAGPMPGVVRPLLRWTTSFRPAQSGEAERPEEMVLP